MKTSDFDYYLPREFIAQTPAEPRDSSRLMVLNRGTGQIEHRRFREVISYLVPGDVLVFNDSRVIPARLEGRKADSGGRLEILLLRRDKGGNWEALVRPGRRVRVGARIEIRDGSQAKDGPETVLSAEVVGVKGGGIKVLSFDDEGLLPQLGRIPLPPYIRAPLGDPERYQTVYARVAGSVAAPTAGLHFTLPLLREIEQKGIRCLFTSLHIGLDTFRPVREEDPRRHPVYSEYGRLNESVAAELSQARIEGRRIICVGTSTVRIVEGAARLSKTGPIEPFEGWTDLFILPGYQFRMVDGLITNFHLPRSSLLMLISAFANRDLIKMAYQEAIAREYRFYSFGDAMLII